MLGTLARWLRAIGHDVLYEPHIDDADLVARAVAEDRVILTRDRRLVERRLAANHVLVADDDIDRQLGQVVRELSLDRAPPRPFGRCLDCNTPLETIDVEEARCRVPPYVAATQGSFRHCRACDRIYWRATHVENMWERLRALGLKLPQEARTDTARPDGVD